MNYEETFYGCSMTMKRQDIRENWRHITRPTVVCQKLCERLWNLPTIQDRSKPFPSFLFTHSWSSYNSTVCKLLYGFHYGSTHVGWVRFYPSRGRPGSFEGGNFVSLHQIDHIRRHGTTFTRQPLQTIWPTR